MKEMWFCLDSLQTKMDENVLNWLTENEKESFQS